MYDKQKLVCHKSVYKRTTIELKRAKWVYKFFLYNQVFMSACINNTLSSVFNYIIKK
jgi:hypothetical protein